MFWTRQLGGWLLSAIIPLFGFAAERTPTMTYATALGLKIYEGRLDNGLRMVVVPNAFAPVLTYRTIFKVGSVDEETGKRGIAHLFEHMMFRETKHLKNGEFDKRVTELGGTSLNAYTSTDRTVYVQSLPSPFLEDIAKLEAERMVHLTITPEKLDLERGAVLSEYYMGLNNPGRFFFKSLNELLYEQHPYRYDVIGTEAEIKAFTVKQCLEFYAHFYSPANATVIVAGDVTPERVFQVIKKHYGAIPAQPVKRPTIPQEPPRKEQGVKEVQHPYASQVEMGMAVKLMDFEEDELPYLLVLSHLLGSDEFGLAYAKIIKKGLGTSVNSYFDLNPQGQPHAFYFLVVLAPDVPTKKLRLVTLDVFDQLKARVLSTEKIQMAVNQVKLRYFVNANEDLADLVIDGLNYKDDPTFAYRFFYETFLKTEFSPKKLLKIARKYFDPRNMVFLFLRPGPNEALASRPAVPGQS